MKDFRVRGKTLCIMPSSTTECGKLEPVSGMASLSQSPYPPPFKGAHQGLRAFHRRSAALPANSGPASEDAFPEEFRLRGT